MSIYRCALEMSTNSQKYVNIFHVDHVSGEADSIANAFLAQVSTAYSYCLVTQVTLDQMVVTELSNHEQYTQALDVPGTITSDMCPPQSAAVISWKTTKAGRAFRGRTFVPGLSEGSQTDGILANSYKNLLNGLANAIHLPWMQTLSASHVIYHRETGTYDLITSYILRDIVYTQRRRTLGVGS